MTEGKYCIYRHIKPDGEVFYIGIGNLKRPYNKCYRSEWWKKVVKKYPEYQVDIMKYDLTWEDAQYFETILIKHYGRKDLGLGTLVNMTDGGDGVKNPSPQVRKMSSERAKNRIITDEFREVCRNRMIGKKFPEHSERMKGEGNPNFGKKTPDHVKAATSAHQKGKIATEETRRKMSEKRKGGKHNLAKKVINKDTLEIYECVKYAANSYGINYRNLLSRLNGIVNNNTNLIYLSEYQKLHPDLDASLSLSELN